jgi:hypothetical protein
MESFWDKVYFMALDRMLERATANGGVVPPAAFEGCAKAAKMYADAAHKVRKESRESLLKPTKKKKFDYEDVDE